MGVTTDHEPILRALRDCPTWDEIAAALSTTVDEARAAARRLLEERVPPVSGEVCSHGVSARIARDGWGVPHIRAESETGAYFALGFAMGQDRLWQMDYLRRAADGTLAQVMGPGLLESDRLSRTLDIRRTAEACAARLDPGAIAAVESFCGGINLARCLAEREGLPFEFELLEYAPEPWSPADSVAVMRLFAWQLTGRFPAICLPEVARRILGDGPLFDLFLEPEGGQTTIWPRGVPYPDLPRWSGGRLDGEPFHDAGAVGSNNWVVGPSRSAGGAPLLAGDPHLPFALPSIWYEARLEGGALAARGAFAVGGPGIFYGRNADVAWAITNNISSLRDLYVEVTDDFDSSRYRRSESWEGMTVRREVIEVWGAPSVDLQVREVDHGPVVTDLLPEWAQTGDTISMRWVGSDASDEMAAMIAFARSRSVSEFRGHLRRWSCPTFNFVMADGSGEIGYQLTGSIPLRRSARRGYRRGDDTDDAWAGFVPYDALPAAYEPPEGWLGSANNMVATEDWPFPLSGFWPSDYRMQRLAHLLNRPGEFTLQDMARIQLDATSLRATEWAACAVSALRDAGVEDLLLDEIAAWDGSFGVESRPAGVFEAFFFSWCRAVLARRFPADMIDALYPNTAGLSERLLKGDPAGWFSTSEERRSALSGAWDEALAWLGARLGPDRDIWRWGSVHTLTLAHPLGRTPALRELLGRGPLPHGGGWNALNNSQYASGQPFETLTGVSFRMLIDLAGEMKTINSGGQSGHPGSPHYDDQLSLWQAGEYHALNVEEPAAGAVWLIRPE